MTTQPSSRPSVSAEAVELLTKRWERFAKDYPKSQSHTGHILKECAAELRALLPAQSPADPLHVNVVIPDGYLKAGQALNKAQADPLEGVLIGGKTPFVGGSAEWWYIAASQGENHWCLYLTKQNEWVNECGRKNFHPTRDAAIQFCIDHRDQPASGGAEPVVAQPPAAPLINVEATCESIKRESERLFKNGRPLDLADVRDIVADACKVAVTAATLRPQPPAPAADSDIAAGRVETFDSMDALVSNLNKPAEQHELPTEPGRWTREVGKWDGMVERNLFAGFKDDSDGHRCTQLKPLDVLPTGGWVKASAEREELERLRAEQQEALDLNNEMKRLCDDACDQRDAAKQREESLRKELENKQFVIDGYDRTHERLDRKITSLESELATRAEVIVGGDGVRLPEGWWGVFAKFRDNALVKSKSGWLWQGQSGTGNKLVTDCIAIRLPATSPSSAPSESKLIFPTEFAKRVAELYPSPPASELEQGERWKLAAALTTLLAKFKAADDERLEETESAHKEADKWKAEGDMYGYNFHEGRSGGTIWASIIYERVRRELKMLIDQEGNRE